MTILNPTNLSFTHDGKNTDGSAFDPTLFNGFEVQIDGIAALSIPITWNTQGTYTAPIAPLGLATGSHTIAVQLLSKNGNNSAWSVPSAAFSIDLRTPTAPLAVTVA